MAKFEILISSTAEKQLKKIPKKDISKIVILIRSLSRDPHPPGCRKIMGQDSIYRVRQGRYRIIYEIKKKELLILILKIGHRKSIYQR